jgi:hypothetical protein
VVLLTATPPGEFLPVLADRERFEIVERRIAGIWDDEDPKPGELETKLRKHVRTWPTVGTRRVFPRRPSS